jgi:soluble lytic murein transglycosylase
MKFRLLLKLLVVSVASLSAVRAEAKIDYDALTLQQRTYLKTVSLYKSGKTAEAEVLAAGLKGYVLKPYLDYYDLYYNPASSRLSEVQRYIASSKNEGLISDLQAKYVRTLYKDGRYSDIPKIRKKPFRLLSLNCIMNSALYKSGSRGPATEFMRREYMKGGDMPSECSFLLQQSWKDGVISYRTDYSKLLKKFTVRRQEAVIGSLAKKLNGTAYASSAKVVAYLYGHPEDVLKRLDKNVHDYKNVAVGTILLVSRKNAEKALSLLSQVVKEFGLSPEQEEECNSYIIRHLMQQKRSEHMQWLDRNLVKLRHPDDLIQNRVKFAIWQENWRDLDVWLKRLSPKEAKESKWTYWRAFALEKQGRAKEARDLYLKVLSERNFYSFMVSQKYSVPWPFLEQKVSISPLDEKKALEKWVEFARVKELLAVGDISNAGREWYHFIRRLSPDDVAKAGVLAYNRGWYDYSLKACIYGKAWNLLQLRFPMPMRDYYKKMSRETGVSESFLYAISRQESALNPGAVSPVGARGMMQLMPATASMVAKKYNIPYSSVSQLLDPETNIALGSHYLEHLLSGYDNNRVLAAVAYNAGPHRVEAWKSKDGVGKSVDVWVENIPFNETRNYVQNVLIFDAIYQKYMKKEPYFLTKKEFTYKY